jgi:putative sigma-54 modulation protein
MAIPVHIFAKDMTVSERLEEYIQKKFGKLDHYLDYLEEVRVEVKYIASARQNEDRHVAQVTARGRGKILRVEERNEDIFAAIDTAVDKIERRIEKLKGRLTQKVRSEATSAIQGGTSPIEESTSGESLKPLITRRKNMLLEPMAERDAIEQMQLLGHEEFFVFQNIDNGKISVIYRRRDGDFGIIENEIR